MNYILFDLEWNQCPYGKSRENPRLPFEIIEIGALKLDEEGRQLGSFSEVIRPLVYRRLHFQTKKVIPVKQDELDHARTFCPVIRDFLSWCGEEYKFVTWGSLDLEELQRNMDYYHLKNPFPLPLFYCDLQKMYSILYSDGKTRISLEEAVDEMQIPKDIPFHRAADDTYYTAEVFKRMDFARVKMYESVDYHRLPKEKGEEIFCRFPTYTKFVSRCFPGREALLSDRKTVSMRCHRCGLPLKRKMNWFAAGSSVYLSLGQCPIHGPVKGKIRIKKAGDAVFAIKTIKAADEESVDRIAGKKQQIREKRRVRRKSGGG